MSQPSPEHPSEKRSVWPLLAAGAFLVISLAAAGMAVAGVDPGTLFPTPTNRSVLILLTSVPPTDAPTPSPAGSAQAQNEALIRLIPPQGDASGLAGRLPDAIRSALEGSPLAQQVQVETGQPAPDDALQVAWQQDDGGLLRLTIHSRFAPVPVAAEDSLEPIGIVGPETTPLIVDPAADPALPAGLTAELLELELGPDAGTLDRIRELQGLPSALKPGDQTRNQAIILFAIAQAQMALGDPTTALDSYSQALRLQSDFPAAVLNRGSVYLALGDSTTALAVYHTLQDAAPYQAVIGYNRALATISGDDLNAALRSADQLVNADPTSAWRVNLRGYVHFRRGDFESAQADFKQASGLAPGTPVLLSNQAQALTSLKQFDQALEVYAALTALEPNEPRYRFKQAIAYEAAGKSPSALDALSQAIVLDDKYTDAYLERARLEVRAGACDKALADADQALTLDPKSGPAYQVSGDCLLAQEDWIKAEKAYTAAADLGVSTIDLFEGRGWAHHRQREMRNAVDDYQQAISLGANDTALLLRLGFALLDTNQKKEALNAFLGAVNGGMDTAEAHAGLALALDMNYRTDEANREYQHALSLDPRFGDRAYLAGQPLWSSASIGRAMAIVKRLK